MIRSRLLLADFEADRPMAALGWMLLCGLAFSFMGLVVKVLSATVPVTQLVFFRAVVNFVLVAALLWITRENIFPKRGKALLVSRGIAGSIGLGCHFYAIAYLPLSVAALLSWCTPLFVVLVARAFLGERLRRRVIPWMVLAGLGLLLILSPGLEGAHVESLPWFPMAIGLFGAFAVSFAYVFVRAASSSFSTNLIVFYFTGIGTLASAPTLIWGYETPTASGWVLLITIGLLAYIGQVSLTNGYRMASASLVSVMSLLSAGFQVLWSWLFLGEILSTVQWIGILSMAAAVFQVARTGAPSAPEPPQIEN